MLLTRCLKSNCILPLTRMSPPAADLNHTNSLPAPDDSYLGNNTTSQHDSSMKVTQPSLRRKSRPMTGAAPQGWFEGAGTRKLEIACRTCRTTRNCIFDLATFLYQYCIQSASDQQTLQLPSFFCESSSQMTPSRAVSALDEFNLSF